MKEAPNLSLSIWDSSSSVHYFLGYINFTTFLRRKAFPLLRSIARVKPRSSDSEQYTVMNTVRIILLAPYSDSRERFYSRQHHRQSVTHNEQSANETPARLTEEIVLRIYPTRVFCDDHEPGENKICGPYCHQSHRDEEIDPDVVAEMQCFG